MAARDAVGPLDLVRDFCAACEKGDIDALLEYFTDDAVYHNMPVAPVQGKDAIRTTFEMFMTGVEKIEFRVRNIVADGDVVLTERVDVFVLPNATIELPVMGTFEVRDGRIAAWRDYFDLNQYMQQIPAG
jgi:limonene-1,2-epoxide hydrolase